MKRILSLFIFATAAMTTMAQETYDNAMIATEDLNGTARYVGMGGAMDALGADLTTIGTNPAGIGLFRSSQAKVTFGVVSQEGVEDFANNSKTKLSIDQAGFVYSARTGESSFLNFAINYKKSRNFNQILSATGVLDNASQNKQSYMKGASGIFNPEVNKNGYIDSKDNSFTQLDYLYYNTLVAEPDADGNPIYGYNNATGYIYNSYNKGYIGEYDFNISGNVNDRLYLGMTVGVHGVHYTGYSEYSEKLVDANNAEVGNIHLADERRISGTGYNVKAGVIFRPLEYSPFRIGLSIATPTWYSLTSENFTIIQNNTDLGSNGYGQIDNSYDFKLSTPWKFGVSAGTTIANMLALGAVYEFADYGSIDPRINDGEYYYDDYYYSSYYESSSTDAHMKRHTSRTLKGVSTFKIGAELRPDVNMAVRLGYNYVSPMYQSDAQKSYDNHSPAMYYTSTTAFTNWKETQRITCGIGYTWDKFTLDAAYQYTMQKGEFYPFNSVSNSNIGESNIVKACDVENNRHQVLVTLGYAF